MMAHGASQPSCSFFGTRHDEKQSVPQDKEDDALLARDLNALTMDERNLLYDEVHGVNEIQEETPSFLAGRIEALKTELSKYPMTKRRSFDRACFLRPTLENDEKLFLIFLRGTRFDVKAAARLLCIHFDHKLELFGEAKLPKTITLEDLDDDDLEVFKTGSYIIVPKKDRSGRQPQLINLSRMKYKHWKNQVRYTWYNAYTVLLADEDVQKRGTVDVMYFVDMNKIPDTMMDYVRDAHHILSAMPARTCGFHVCYNNKVVRWFLSFLHVVTSKERKLRERIHFGSHLEVVYALCTFGIDIQDLGAFGDEYIENFLEQRRTIEAEEKVKEQEREQQTGVIMYPSPLDVLCGRGRPYQDFVGNVRVSQLVDEHVPLYLRTQERLKKTTIASGIVKSIHDAGGRFLTRRDDGWEIASDKVARGKISQALRVRTLKKVREDGSEASPVPSNATSGWSMDASEGSPKTQRDSKRLRMSDTSSGEADDDDDCDDTLEDFDMKGLPLDGLEM